MPLELRIGQTFLTQEEGVDHVYRFIVQQHESLKCAGNNNKSKQDCFYLTKLTKKYLFKVRLVLKKKDNTQIVVAYKKHTYPIKTYTSWKYKNSLRVLVPKHLATITNNRNIKLKQIVSNKRLSTRLHLPLKQTYQVLDQI